MDKELEARVATLEGYVLLLTERLDGLTESVEDLEDWQEETHETVNELVDVAEDHDEELAVDDARLTEVEEVVGLDLVE